MSDNNSDRTDDEQGRIDSSNSTGLEAETDDGWAYKIPGMVPGKTLRNVGVGFVYFIAIILLLRSGLALLAPFILAIVVGFNIWNTRDRLNSKGVPLMTGGLKAGVVVFVASFLAVALAMGAVGPSPDAGDVDETVLNEEDTDPEEQTDDPDEESDETVEEDTQEETDDEEAEETTEAADESDEVVEEVVEDSDEEEVAEVAKEEETPESIEEDEAPEREAEDDVEEEVQEAEELDEVVDSVTITTELFESFLISEGFDVIDVSDSGNAMQVEYRSYIQTEEELAGEIGYITGAYAAAVDSGHESDYMIVIIYDSGGTPIGEYQVNADEAQAWYNGEMSDEEFFGNVLNSLETY